MSDGIEKLKELANQIEREHVSELHALKERYKTYLREAHEARDIAIKEASKLRNDVNLAKDLVPDFTSDIAIMLGISCYGMTDEVQEAIEAELHNRLMPPGMDWPRFDDGKQITCDDAPEDIAAVCLALDGSCYSLHYDMPDDERMFIYEVSERVKRPVTEVLGADGKPIKVGETVYSINTGREFEVARIDASYGDVGTFTDACRAMHFKPNWYTHKEPDTQERINRDATLSPIVYCPTCGAKVVEL